jgi:hypothetical protein
MVIAYAFGKFCIHLWWQYDVNAIFDVDSSIIQDKEKKFLTLKAPD